MVLQTWLLKLYLYQKQATSWSSRCCLLPYFLGLDRKNLNHPSITKMWTQSEFNHSFQIQISSFLSYMVHTCCHICFYHIWFIYGSAYGWAVKNLPTNSGDTRFDPWVRKIPWRGKWQPTPVFLPGKSCTGGPGGLQSTGLQRVEHDWGAEHTRRDSPQLSRAPPFLPWGTKV